MATAASLARPASRPEGILTLLLGTLTAFGALSIDMYLPAFPAMAADLGVTVAAVQFTLATFFAGLAVGQLGTGPIIDRFGRTRTLFAGLALYVAGSLACALAGSVEVLAAFRFVQALGGAVCLVVSRAVVRDLHSGAAAARMLSRLILVMGVAPILAPLLGGWVLEVTSWRAIFLVLATIGALALVASWRLLPETAPSRTGASRPLAQLAALVRAPDFVRPALAVAFAFAGMFAYIAGSPFVFIELFHVPAEDFGWLFGANAAGLVVASQVNHRLLERWGPARILSTALVVSALAGAALLGVVLTGAGGLWGVFGCLFAFVSSMGFVAPNATALALEHHRERAGMASALLGAAQFTVAASASSAVGALHDGSALPMAAVLASAGVLALGVARLGLRRTPAADVADPAVELSR